MKVVKFGGSSLTDGQNVEQALNIVLSDPERRAIVVSAPGKRSDDDIKITDLLIKYAGMTFKSEDTNEIVQNIFIANCNNKLNTFG